jgi:hypothetical protein
MYLIGLGFSSGNRSSDSCIQQALVFYGENQAQDRCIRPALDSPMRTDPMLRSLYPIGLSVFRREPIKWLFKFSTSFSTSVEVLFNYLIFVLCTPSCSSLRRSVKSMFF